MFKVISEDVAKKCKLGSFPVSVISHFALPISDGEKIALKFFFPSSDLSHTVFANCKTQLIYFPANAKSESKYPAILEYIPYRKADRLAERDHKQHVWMASYGFVIIRADLRGSGRVYHLSASLKHLFSSILFLNDAHCLLKVKQQ